MASSEFIEWDDRSCPYCRCKPLRIGRAHAHKYMPHNPYCRDCGATLDPEHLPIEMFDDWVIVAR